MTPLRRGAAIAAAIVVLGLAVVVVRDRHTTWTAELDVAVVPQPEPDPYTLSVLDRDLMVPTFAAILHHRHWAVGRAPAATVRITAAPTAAVITVSARADDPHAAESAAQGTFDDGRRYLDRLDRLYSLRRIRTRGARPTAAEPSALASLVAVAGAVFAMALAFTVLRAGRR